MQQSIPAGDGKARGWVAASVGAAVLLGVCAARWRGFAYPHYLGAVIFQCGALALFFIWAWPRPSPAGSSRSLGPAAYLLCAYAAFSVASCLWAPDHRLSAIGSLPILFGVIWALGLGHLLTDPRQIRLVLRAAFFAGTVAALAGIGYVLGSGDPHWLASVNGLRGFIGALTERSYLLEQTQGHRNFLAIFLLPPMVIGLADLLTPVLTKDRQRGAALHLPVAVVAPCLLVILAAFALCKSSGASLGLVAGIACVFAARLSWRARGWLLAVAVALVIVMFAALAWSPLHERLMKSPDQATRWFMWQGAVRMIMDNPVLGWGSGMFMPRFGDYKPAGAMELGVLGNVTIYPHNELLLVAAEGGLIALGLYLAAHVFAAGGHLRKAESVGAPLRIAAWAVFGGFLAMFAHGLVEVALRFWAPAALYWTLLGVMIACGRVEGPAPAGARPRSRADAWLLFAGASGMALAAAVGVIYCGARAEWLLNGASSKPGIETKELIRNDIEAARFSRYVRDYLIALTSRAELEARSGNENTAIAEFEKIERLAPGYGPVRRILATLYRNRARKITPLNSQAGMADFKKAADWIELAVRQNPYDVESRLLYADLLLQASDRNLPAAIVQLRAAADADLKWARPDPKRMEARCRLAQVLARSGQRQEALTVLDEAAAVCTPGDPWARSIKNLKDQLGSR